MQEQRRIIIAHRALLSLSLALLTSCKAHEQWAELSDKVKEEIQKESVRLQLKRDLKMKALEKLPVLLAKPWR